MNDMTKAPQVSRKPREQLLAAEKLMASYQEKVAKFTAKLAEKQIEFLTVTHTPESETKGLSEYLAQTLIFNTRLRAYPAVIVMCQKEEDVVQAYRLANKLSLPIRVRSGGHDHEGECTGNDLILLDLSGLKSFRIDKNCQDQSYTAHIGSGYRFFQLVPKLAANKPALTIPHGTCATVGLAGYIQGGGWGPWTRKHGMCCDSLVAAKVLLENGQVVHATENCYSDLLWALRGGGAFSYGIVLEFSVKAFEIPDEIHRFEIHWNVKNVVSGKAPTYQVLSQWEKVINDPSITQLVGTNLKINALALTEKNAEKPIEALRHGCVMYGYWEGIEQSIADFARRYFPEGEFSITGTDTAESYSASLMGNWARNSLYDLKHRAFLAKKLKGEHTPFSPDYDEPAPHKITSKVVSQTGLDVLGKTQLIQSLTSPLIAKKSEQLGLFSYVTLGAISGPFYQHETLEKAYERMAFPYATSQYTIQYQTWWNERNDEKEKGQHNKVFNYVNRALDWMEVCRDTNIHGTKGAFISFKDSAIPTRTYFQQSYEQLLKVKEKYNDLNGPYFESTPKLSGFNQFRSRKTIL